MSDTAFDVAETSKILRKHLRDQGLEPAHETDPDYTFPGEGRSGLKISVTTVYREVTVSVSMGGKSRKDSPRRVLRPEQVAEAKHYIDTCVADYRAYLNKVN